MADLSDEIETAAATPSSASVDGQSATARSIPDLVKADQYLAQKASRRTRRRGMFLSKIIPPGPGPDAGSSAFDSNGGVR